MITLGRPGGSTGGSRLPFAPPVHLGPPVIVADITDVRVGTDQAKAVMFRGVQVWPPAKAWFKSFVDATYNFSGGLWVAPAPDLSDKPAPVKGSIVFSIYLYAGSIYMAPVIYNGTTWAQSAESMQPAFGVDLRGVSDYTMGKWWNSPTAAAEYANWASDPSQVISGESSVAAYAAPDGIHIRITDKDGANPTDFVEPYPTGVTMADMPPSADLI